MAFARHSPRPLFLSASRACPLRGRCRGSLLVMPGKVQSLSHFAFQFLADIGVVAQELPGIFPALPDALTSVGEPRAALFENVALGGDIDQIAFLGYPLAVQDIKFGLPK